QSVRAPGRSYAPQLVGSLRDDRASHSSVTCDVRVLIYAPAARMGGARSHVLGLVPELATITPEDETLLLAQPDLLRELPLLRASLRAATRVLTPTRAMRQDVVMQLPDVAPKVDVALWGVAPTFHNVRWRQLPGDVVILGVSKHGINKEFDVLIAALPEIVRR